MTILQAIVKADHLRPNTYDEPTKKTWLNSVDLNIQRDIIDTCEGGEPFSGYDEQTSDETELLAPAPFDEMYVAYIHAMIDFYNGEIDRYNNNMARYSSIYRDFAEHYNRNHMPLQGSKINYLGGE